MSGKTGCFHIIGFAKTKKVKGAQEGAEPSTTVCTMKWALNYG